MLTNHIISPVFSIRTIVFSLIAISLFSCKADSNQANDKELVTLSKDSSLSGWSSIHDIKIDEYSGSKFYLIDIYTSWCTWCKLMDKKTFADPEVKKLLKEHFVTIKMDAESKLPLTFKGVDYEWQSGGKNGIHGLAIELLNGRMTYPALVYLDANLEIIRVSNGYKNPAKLTEELNVVMKS